MGRVLGILSLGVENNLTFEINVKYWGITLLSMCLEGINERNRVMKQVIVSMVLNKVVPALLGAFGMYLATHMPEIHFAICGVY